MNKVKSDDLMTCYPFLNIQEMANFQVVIKKELYIFYYFELSLQTTNFKTKSAKNEPKLRNDMQNLQFFFK